MCILHSVESIANKVEKHLNNLDFINKYFASLPGLKKLCLCQYIVARPLKKKEKREFSTTILIPCKNEKGNIESAVKRIPLFGKHHEIIFVDGHSTDGTQKEVNRIIKAYPDKDIKLISLWFTDILGFLKSFDIAPRELEVAMVDGAGFDGSSVVECDDALRRRSKAAGCVAACTSFNLSIATWV